MATTYDSNVDYQALINKANATGNTKQATLFEQQRNAKIADMNNQGINTNNYKTTSIYQSPTAGTTLENYGGDWSNVQSDMAIPFFDSKNLKNIQGDITDIISALNTYEKSDSMSRDESNARAYSQLNGMYNANLDKQLDNYNKDAVSRGMFGQLPTEALKQSAISDSELNKTVAINNLSNSMYTEDFNMARQEDADFYTRQNSILGALGQSYDIESNIYNNKLNEFNTINNLATNQDTTEKANILERLNMLGYADQTVASYLGVPVGTPSEQINLLNLQQDQSKEMLGIEQGYKKDLMSYENNLSRELAAYKATLEKSSTETGAKPISWDWEDSQKLWGEARNLATTLANLNNEGGDTSGYSDLKLGGLDIKKKTYTDTDIEKIYLYLYDTFTKNPEDLALAKMLEENEAQEGKYYSSPVLNNVRNKRTIE